MNETLQTIIPYLVVWIGLGIFTYFIVKKSREKIGIDKYTNYLTLLFQKEQLKNYELTHLLKATKTNSS